MLERRAIIARRLRQTARAVVTSTLLILLPHERAEGKKIRSGRGRKKEVDGGSRAGCGLRDGLPARFDDQDHAGAEHGDITVVALEGGDGGLVGGGNRVESFAAFHLMAEHGGLAGSIWSGVA